MLFARLLCCIFFTSTTSFILPSGNVIGFTNPFASALFVIGCYCGHTNLAKTIKEFNSFFPLPSYGLFNITDFEGKIHVKSGLYQPLID